MQVNDDCQENNIKFLYQIPNKKGRNISLVIQTTGLSENNNVIELGSFEIIDGIVTNDSFQIQIKPRYIMDAEVMNKNKKENDFFEYVKDISPNEINNLKSFVAWVGESKIFCHNANFVIKQLENRIFILGIDPYTPRAIPLYFTNFQRNNYHNKSNF